MTFHSKFFAKHSQECKVAPLTIPNALGVVYDSPKGERDFVWYCDTHEIMIVPNGTFRINVEV